MLVITQRGTLITVERDGTTVSEGPADQRAELLRSLRPTDKEEELLGERWDDEEGNDDGEEEWLRPALPAAVTVDGQPWGWSGCEDEWHVSPLGKGEELARLAGGFEGSMTGIVFRGYVIRRGDYVLAVVWDDIDGLRYRETAYDSDTRSGEQWDRLLGACAAQVGPDDLMCPLCEEFEDWVVDVTALRPPFTDSGLAAAIGSIWCPCTEHEAAGVTLEDIAGRDWVWNEEHWVVADGGLG
jgi:hypothetical protein